MARFKYTAMDQKGRETTGEIDADNQPQALAKIREKGLYPTKVAPAGSGKGAGLNFAIGGKGKKAGAGGKIKTKQLMTFTRQLATLVDAGLPLVRGLTVLERQERTPALKFALSGMAESIQTGSTFAEALAQHPKIFNKLYVNMAKAGEVGGVLDKVLIRLAEFMEKAQKIKNKVVSAMVYPIVVMVMAIAILTFLMVFIIPKFEEIFKELLEGKELPVLTQMVLGVSRTLTQNLPVVIVLIILMIIGLRIYKRTDKGRFMMDRLKLNMPIFGILMRKTAIARFSRTLGTLMTSGVPVLQALNIVRDTSGNEVVAKAVNVIHDSVKEGENMAPPMESTQVFPPMVISMVQVGEETGELPEMLMKIADNYDDEVDNTVAGLTSVIEPLLIVFLALIVGTIVIALFLPLISIIGNLSSG